MWGFPLGHEGSPPSEGSLRVAVPAFADSVSPDSKPPYRSESAWLILNAQRQVHGKPRRPSDGGPGLTLSASNTLMHRYVSVPAVRP